MTEEKIKEATVINNAIKAINKFIWECEESKNDLECASITLKHKWNSEGAIVYVQDPDIADLIIDHLRTKVMLLKDRLEVL